MGRRSVRTVGDLPSGTVTFLFTDLESSTQLWEQSREAMSAALAQHDALLRDAIEANGGHVLKYLGDGCMAVFATAGAGVSAAVSVQRALEAAAWPETGPLRVRIGLHTGEATVREGDYFGPSVIRASRLMSVSHGGQIVCSTATAELARDVIAEDVTFADLGEHGLRHLTGRERVFQVNAEGLRHDFPALASVDAFPGNLPVQVSSFIGRDKEMARVASALEEAPVVTITGVGGVGKTRLAVQVASQLLSGFREGAWLIELAPVRDPGGVEGAFGSLFGVTAKADTRFAASLVDFLRTKHLLLVIDNCEHVLEPVAALVDQISRSCPNVVVLATSREGLGLEGERIVPAPPLGGAPPDADVDMAARADAVRLFVARATDVEPDFALTDANVAAITQICRRLDGVPLAIELAATRVTSMTPAELATALDHRFDVLAGGRRGAVKRHQTLRATIDWSYDLLDEPRQVLLDRLSVFAGGCTRQAAEAVCSGGPVDARTVHDLLAGLVHRSLIVADRGGLETRYRLSDTIREYAEERAAERNETYELRDRHAHYFAEYLALLNDESEGPGQVVAGKRLALDGDNVVAAYAHGLDSGDLNVAMAIIAALPRVGMVGPEFELPAEPVLALPGVAQHPVYPLALMAAGSAAYERGDIDLALTRWEDAAAAERALPARPPYSFPVAAGVKVFRGNLAFNRGEWGAAAERYLECVPELRASGEPYGEVHARVNAAAALISGGRESEAVPIAIEALEGARTLGAPFMVVASLSVLASASARSDPVGARAALDEALTVMAAHEFEATSVMSLVTGAARAVGDWVLTSKLAARAIHLLQWGMSSRYDLGTVLRMTAHALASTDPEGAAVIRGGAHSISASLAARRSAVPDPSNIGHRAPGAEIGPDDREFVFTASETSRRITDALGEPRARALHAKGAAMDVDQLCAYALARIDAFLRSETTPLRGPEERFLDNG